MKERIARLTPRQRDCLYLVHEGYSGKEVADALGISPNVVKEHLEAARATLGVQRSLRAARLLVDATGLPPNVGGLRMGGGDSGASNRSGDDRSEPGHGAGLEMRESVASPFAAPSARTGIQRLLWSENGKPTTLAKVGLALLIALVAPVVFGAVLMLQFVID